MPARQQRKRVSNFLQMIPLVAWNNRNTFPHSSGGQKPEVSMPGPKSQCHQGHPPSRSSGRTAAGGCHCSPALSESLQHLSLQLHGLLCVCLPLPDEDVCTRPAWIMQ